MNVDYLLGKTLTHVGQTNNEILFVTSEGESFKLTHLQDDTEVVTIEDINGNLGDLVGLPLLIAEETVSFDNPEGVVRPQQHPSFTWTFYKFATAKGYVTIRWYGESSGTYSERVDFVPIWFDP